jgi:four helix bundle protein
MKPDASSSSPDRSIPTSSAMNGLHDHERLDVYRLELAFIAWLNGLLDEIRDSQPSRSREICDQLDRASISMTLNTAEGNGRRPSRARAKFFDDARGSATECAACLDILAAKGLCKAPRTAEGKAHLLRIVAMLSRLVDRFEDLVRENPPTYRSDVEDETEGETPR